MLWGGQRGALEMAAPRLGARLRAAACESCASPQGSSGRSAAGPRGQPEASARGEVCPAGDSGG